MRSTKMKILLLLSIGFSAASGLTCDKVGYIPGNDGYCYKFVQNFTSYANAAMDCATSGARLATVTNMDQQQAIVKMAPTTSGNPPKVHDTFFPTFIGYNTLGPLRKWAFDSPSANPEQDGHYAPWHPDSCTGFHCTTQQGTVAIMSGQGWDMQYPSDYNKFTYICQYMNNEVGPCSTSNSVAPVPFKPLTSTGKCYSIADNAKQHQASAENQCNQYGGHLAKIGSYNENQFLLQQFCWECIGNGTAQAWIRLYTTADGKLTWTDGTKFQPGDYSNFGTTFTPGNCVVMMYPSGQWAYEDCDDFNAYALCNRGANNKMIEKKIVLHS